MMNDIPQIPAINIWTVMHVGSNAATSHMLIRPVHVNQAFVKFRHSNLVKYVSLLPLIQIW